MKKVLTICGHEEMEGELERILKHAKEDALITSVELKHFVWNDAKARAVDGFFQCNHNRCSLVEELTVQSCTGIGPPVWTSIPFLKRLTLSMVNISLPLLFPRSLEELSLFEVSLSNDVAAALGESLAQPASCCLEKLDLTDSRFLANGVTLLARGLAKNTSLKSLSVSECNLMDEQVARLVGALEYHASIRELDISFNKCRHSGVNALARLFESNVCRLSKLSMDFQAFGECHSINLGPILSAISSSPPSSSSLSCNTSFLRDLGLGGNSLRDLQMPSLVDALCANPTIEKLDLSENRFTDVGIELLAKRLHEMKGLKQLVLEDNRFGISGLKSLAVAMESNLMLEDIEVTPKLMRGEWWSKIVWYMDLNWGGRRLLRQEAPLPGGLWPLVLERASRGAEQGMSRTPSAPDIVYCLVRGPALLER